MFNESSGSLNKFLLKVCHNKRLFYDQRYGKFSMKRLLTLINISVLQQKLRSNYFYLKKMTIKKYF